MQASYTIGLGTTMQENQPAVQIAAKHSFFPQMMPYMSWIFLVLVGIDPGVSRLGGEIVSHNTTNARHASPTVSMLIVGQMGECLRRWAGAYGRIYKSKRDIELI